MADKTEEKVDAVLSRLDAWDKRMDAMEEGMKSDRARLDAACGMMDAMKKDADEEKEEKAKADAARADAEKEEKEKEEKAKADKARADAEKEEEEKKADKARADAARADAATSDLAKLQADLAALRAAMQPPTLAPEQKLKMVEHQSRWNRVAQAFNDSDGAPPFVNGESELDYRARLASKYQQHAKNPKVKSAKLLEIKDAASLEVIEDAIYADALAEAQSPSTIHAGVLVPRRIKDAAGREIVRYSGDPNACWDQFNPPAVKVVRRILVPRSPARLQ